MYNVECKSDSTMYWKSVGEGHKLICDEMEICMKKKGWRYAVVSW